MQARHLYRCRATLEVVSRPKWRADGGGVDRKYVQHMVGFKVLEVAWIQGPSGSRRVGLFLPSLRERAAPCEPRQVLQKGSACGRPPPTFPTIISEYLMANQPEMPGRLKSIRLQ